VVFRADSFAAGQRFFAALFGLNAPFAPISWTAHATLPVLTALLVGTLFAGPLWGRLKLAGMRLVQTAPAACRPSLQTAGLVLELGLTVSVLVLSAAWLASGTYNPFIYYRF
jgi:alginate O-acetyltransferase complex protein AlgI